VAPQRTFDRGEPANRPTAETFQLPQRQFWQPRLNSLELATDSGPPVREPAPSWMQHRLRRPFLSAACSHPPPVFILCRTPHAAKGFHSTFFPAVTQAKLGGTQ